MLWDLFRTFARMGILTYGGGYAMLPILEREVVEKKGWVTEEEVLDYYALGQCTPGIIAVNAATFIGQKKKGTLGGIVATLGVISPSLVIITLIAMFLSRFAEYPVVQHAFAGIRVSVLIMIINILCKVCKRAVKDRFSLIVFLSVALMMTALEFLPFSVSPVWSILAAAAAGLIYQNRRVKP